MTATLGVLALLAVALPATARATTEQVVAARDVDADVAVDVRAERSW